MQPKVARLTGRLGATQSNPGTRIEAQVATVGASHRTGRANYYQNSRFAFDGLWQWQFGIRKHVRKVGTLGEGRSTKYERKDSQVGNVGHEFKKWAN